jgi:hypothetical protein
VRGAFACICVALVALGCAGSGGWGRGAGSAPYDPMGGGLADRGSDQAFSRARFPLRMGYRQALERFAEGAACGGPDSPESIIGRPDRRNQIHVARDRIVTYGFKFQEATLLIRCRADVVEVARSLR